MKFFGCGSVCLMICFGSFCSCNSDSSGKTPGWETTQKKLDSIDSAFSGNFQLYKKIDSLIVNDSFITTKHFIDSILKAKPANQRLRLLRGDFFIHHKMIDSAIVEYTLCVENGYNPIGLERRASAYILLGKFELAIPDLKKAASINSDYLYSLGYTYELIKKFDSAVFYFEKYQEISKDNIQSHIDSLKQISKIH